MDQITAAFENIDWDSVMSVVTDYVTKFDVGAFLQTVMDFLKGVLEIVAGGILGGIL